MKSRTERITNKNNFTLNLKLILQNTKLKRQVKKLEKIKEDLIENNKFLSDEVSTLKASLRKNKKEDK